MRDIRDYIGWRRYVCAVLAFLECLFFSGLIYGWNALAYVFRHEGIYSDLCEQKLYNGSLETLHRKYISFNASIRDINASFALNGNSTAHSHYITCKAQDDMFTLVFTVGATMLCVSSAVFGHINLKFGTRVTRSISMIPFISGALMLAFTSKEYPWLMFFGFCCIGFGGLPIFVTNIQISNLFEKGSSTFVGVLNGAYDSSAVVMFLAKLWYENGYGHREYMIGLACFYCLVGINTFFFLPKSYIVKSSFPRTDLETTFELNPVIENDKPGVDVIEQMSPKPMEHCKPSLKECIFSPVYIAHVIWLSLLQLRFFYILGTLNPYLHNITNHNEHLVSYFTDVSSFTMMSGFLSTVLSGVVYDWQKKLYRDTKPQSASDIFSAILPLSIASGFATLLSLLVLLPFEDTLYLTFIVMTCMRSFLYGIGTSFVSLMYPSEYFAMLYGIMIVCGGIIGAGQYALYSWSTSYTNAETHVSIFCTILVVITFAHPIMLYLKARKQRNEHSEKYYQ